MQEACRRCGFDPCGQEDPLEKEVATHSSLEKPTDRGAWQATIQGIEYSVTKQ